MSRGTATDAPPKAKAPQRKLDKQRRQPRLHRRHPLIRALAALWRFIWWVWSTLILGGLIVNIAISYGTNGTSGVTDPTTWPVVKPLLANPVPSLIGVAVAVMITLLAYLAHRYQTGGPEDTQRAEYVLKRVDRLDPDAFVPVYVANVYLRRREEDGSDADQKATDALRAAAARRDPTSLTENPLGICVYGQTMQGKTRLAFERTLQTLPTWTFVSWPQGRPQVPLDFEALRGQKVVLWLDDLQKFGADVTGTVADLPRRFAEARIPLVVVATCRGGEDEKGVSERLGGLRDRLVDVRPANISRQDANTLERELETEGHQVRGSEFDGTPGSLLLGVERMRRQVYPNLSPNPQINLDAQHILWALKLLRSAGIYSYPAPRVRAVAVGVFGFQAGNWRDACNALSAAKFVRLGEADAEGERPLAVVADAYLDKAIPDYPPPGAPGASEADDWPRLQQVLSSPVDADALIYLGIAYWERNLGNLRQNRQRAESCYRAALTVYTREAAPPAWAMTQNNLGNALANQAALAEGEARARLLSEAVAAYRAALTVRTREAAPPAWAMTQNNLAVALRNQASLAEGDARARLLGEAVAAYRAALSVYTREAAPPAWAMTQNNLAIALADQASLAEGDARARLLGEAVAAYRAALTVRTREAAPPAWAMTQNNLAIALADQASLAEGDARARLLGEAVAAYRAALAVRTREAMPFGWAGTHLNLALLGLDLAANEESNGHRDGACAALGDALHDIEDALTVFTAEAVPMYHRQGEQIKAALIAARQELGCD